MRRLASVLSMIGRLLDTAMDRTVAPGYSRIGLAVRKRLPDWPADPPPHALRGKHVLVTGATSGLGTATAEGALALDGHVHLVVRDPAKAEGVRDELIRRHPDGVVTVWRCDVSDLDDVRRFVSEFLGAGVELHALVHNAGAMPPKRTESKQGHEMTMALHLLGPLAMTEALLPTLAPGARVVLVTSGGMYTQALRDDDPEYLKGDYSPTTAYARSKRAQVELLGVLQERWTGVNVYSTHPGWADTPGVQESLPTFRKLTRPILRDAAGGAETTVWLTAVEPAPTGGELWHDRRTRPTSLRRKTVPTEEQRRRIWDWARDAAGLG